MRGRDGGVDIGRACAGGDRDDPLGLAGVGGEQLSPCSRTPSPIIIGTRTGSSRSTAASASESCARTAARRSSSTGSFANGGGSGTATDHNIGEVEAQDRCAACDGTRLEPQYRVAGDAGPDGLIPSTDRFGVALADIVRCSRCGHMQLHPMPSQELLDTGYADAASDDYVEEEAGQRATARRVLEHIERHVPRRGALLDIGCWVGFLLAEARDRGWERTLGVEPSEFASQYARERLGLDVVRGDLSSAQLPAGEFDAITMGDVIEHLRSPSDALARIRSLLAPGGVLWLALPDAGSAVARALGRRWWSVIPTHAQYFTRGSLAGAAEPRRLRGAGRRDCAEGVHGLLLPRARRRLLAGGRQGAAAGGRRDGRGGPHLGTGLPRPDGGAGAGTPGA